jgi:hypothetical protein
LTVHPVDDRAGPDLVERDPGELGCVEGTADHRVGAEESGVGPSVFRGLGEVLPAHEASSVALPFE